MPEQPNHCPTCGVPRWDEAHECPPGFNEPAADTKGGITVKFNPFLFTIEENNAMIAKGWEPIINFDPRVDRRH